MPMSVNSDGKFIERSIAAFAGAVPALLISGAVWWADGRALDQHVAATIARLEKRVDAVETAANNERQRLAELSADVRNLLRSTARIEALLDRLATPAPPKNGQQ